MNSFYSIKELEKLNIKCYGKNVLISRNAKIYGAENISIGNNVRIDDFCILSGRISIGNYIHIAAYTGLYGGDKGIVLHDFSNISSKVTIYSISDDYSGNSMTNPMVPSKYKNVTSAEVVVERHVIIGSGCVVLPGVTLRLGSAFGAMALVNKSSEPWSINAGIPSKKIKNRSRKILNIEKIFFQEENSIE